MANTVTLLNDHLGQNNPRVVGHEYCVDADVDITSYTAGGEVVTAATLGLSSISAVVITGMSSAAVSAGYAALPFFPEVDTSGAYASSSTFQLVVTSASGTDPVGDIRVRVWGTI